MKRVYFVLLVFLAACTRVPSSSTSHILVDSAFKYHGTPYKYAGTTNNGMDCSGLIYKAFEDIGISFMRNSYEQSKVYPSVRLTNLKVGDLVYFKVGKGRNKIDHTGVITKIVDNKTILFLHSSSTRGVIEDNLYSNYWRPKFVKATRPKV